MIQLVGGRAPRSLAAMSSEVVTDRVKRMGPLQLEQTEMSMRNDEVELVLNGVVQHTALPATEVRIDVAHREGGAASSRSGRPVVSCRGCGRPRRRSVPHERHGRSSSRAGNASRPHGRGWP